MEKREEVIRRVTQLGVAAVVLVGAWWIVRRQTAPERPAPTGSTVYYTGPMRPKGDKSQIAVDEQGHVYTGNNIPPPRPDQFLRG
jgi:negative regulator of sigma E activity